MTNQSADEQPTDPAVAPPAISSNFPPAAYSTGEIELTPLTTPDDITIVDRRNDLDGSVTIRR